MYIQRSCIVIEIKFYSSILGSWEEGRDILIGCLMETIADLTLRMECQMKVYHNELAGMG